MDKASAYGAGDCKFESYRGHLIVRGQEMHNFMGGQKAGMYKDPSNVLTRSQTWVVAATTRRPNH